MTEEEQVACAMLRFMAKAGRDEAPAKEIEKDRGGPMKARK